MLILPPMNRNCSSLKTLAYLGILLVSGSLCGQGISMNGFAFSMDGKPFDMWGVRLASASQSEHNTSAIINALDEYQEVGINTISIYLQGSSGGYSDPFGPGGRTIDASHWERLDRLIRACRSRGMVVIVGIFYQRTLASKELRHLQSGKDVRRATRLVAKKLIPYDNVILNIANEQNSKLYRGFESYDFNSSENVIDLCKIAKQEDPNRLVGAGGYNDSLNVVIGRSPHVDLLLFDTYSEDIESGQSSGWHYDYYRDQGVLGKPLVNVEIFGGWTKQFLPQGVYTEQGKLIHLAEIEAAKEREGLYVHFHSNPWFQAKDQGLENQFHLGGRGTTSDPGVRWYFEQLPGQATIVNSLAALQDALKRAQPGDVIALEEGNYEGKDIVLAHGGTADQPIVIRPRSNAKVTIKSRIDIQADYLSLEGMHFNEEGQVIIQGRGCRLSRCSFVDVQTGKWVRVLSDSYEIEIDHNTFEKKTINQELERGCQLMQIVVLNKNEQHHIHDNTFKDIPQGSGNGFETLQIITKDNPFDPPPGGCNSLVENNLFVRCNGESEIISVKSNGNILRGNTFRACRGSLVLRHGDNNVVTHNYFFGDGEKGSGGVRLQGIGQIVANNYFHGLGRFAIAMMDGTPDDLYMRVERAQILCNSIIDCQKSFVIGLNHSKHPNGTVPKDCEVVGNLFSVHLENSNEVIELVQNDHPENWQWRGNVAHGTGLQREWSGLKISDPHLVRNEQGLFVSTIKTPKWKRLDPVNARIAKDILGSIRKKKSAVGAIDFVKDHKRNNHLSF